MSNKNGKRHSGLSLGNIKATFSWPVIVEIPQGINEKGEAYFHEHKIVGKFNLLPQDKIDVLNDRAEDQTEFSFIYDEVVAGWDEVFSDDDKSVALEFNDETKHQLKQTPYIMTGFVTAYFRSQGGKKAQIKN